jgi:hypothetical protein
MESLIKLLLLMVNKTAFVSEADHDEAVDLLRAGAEELGVEDVVPPPRGPTNAPADQPRPIDPGPVAEPVPPGEQLPPPTSPEVAGAAPEESNAFTQPTT